MKKYIAAFFTLVPLLIVPMTPALAIDANKIISDYYTNTGGKEAWKKLKGVKFIGEINQGGMKFPFELVNLKGGKQYMKITLQGKTLKQGVFDGNVMWNTNFMTMKAEKADAETTANQKLNNNDFPDGLFNYKENGYKVELQGDETIDGTETYKIKLVKEPVTVDGKKEDDVSYYYFDTEALVPLVIEAKVNVGPAKGKMSQTKLSDYQEVNGLYFPFSITQGLKDGPSISMVINKVVLNPKVDDSEFSLPAEPAQDKKAEDKKLAAQKD